jgi:hypothetical protein
MFDRTFIKRAISLPALAIVTTVGVISFGSSMMPAQAQSTDRDRPTLLQSNEIQGALPRQADYFYSFNAKSGELKVTIDVTPSGGSIAVASLQFYDANSSELLPVALIPTANSPAGDRKTTTIKIPARQRILMRLTEGTGYGANYKIRLEGAIDLSQPSQGKVLKLPTTGKLSIKLQDGSIHEFDLRDVNQAILKP